MKPQGIFRCFRGGGNNKCQIFNGNDENLIKNGETLLAERVSLFDGKTNPIRCFSVDDLNSMNVNNHPTVENGHLKCYEAVWDDNSVLVKIVYDYDYNHSNEWGEEWRKLACREIAVATQMGTHSNVHRLLGFCLHTNYPVLVYGWEKNGTLEDRIFKHKEQSKQALQLTERLKIAWEIAHAVAYLHTAFCRPIIHRSLEPRNVFLDQDGSAKLSDFSLAISIPKGKKHVDDAIIGRHRYMAPEYLASGRLTELVDVFSFGALLLILLTGKSTPVSDPGIGWDKFVELSANRIGDFLDPVITTNGCLADEHFQSHLKAFIELAIRCIAHDEESRPTMVEVATELESMVMSSSASL